MPRKFEISGGSCYQGITSMFIKFILEICTILNFIALILLSKRKINSPKILNIISLILWCLISFFNSIDETLEDLIIGLRYFFPFLICTLLILKVINDSKKEFKAQN